MIDVGGIEEVDALIEGLVDNPARGGFIRFAAKHHRAQTQGRNLEGAATQIPIVHFISMQVHLLLSRLPYRAALAERARHGVPLAVAVIAHPYGR